MKTPVNIFRAVLGGIITVILVLTLVWGFCQAIDTALANYTR